MLPPGRPLAREGREAACGRMKPPDMFTGAAAPCRCPLGRTRAACMPGHGLGHAALVLRGVYAPRWIPLATSGCAPARQGVGYPPGAQPARHSRVPVPVRHGAALWFHRARIFAMRRLNLAAMRACRSLDAWEIQGRTGRPRPAPTSAAGVEGREGGGVELPRRGDPACPGRAAHGAGLEPCKGAQPADPGAPVRLAWP